MLKIQTFKDLKLSSVSKTFQCRRLDRSGYGRNEDYFPIHLRGWILENYWSSNFLHQMIFIDSKQGVDAIES